MSESPDDIVGHKTFDTGEICPETGFPAMRHEPLTRREADALWERAMALKAKREADMPDEQSAIKAMFEAWQRLKELGWREASYCPKDGTHFQAIESGSTGIHDCNYQGEWASGSWWVYDGDVWPARPCLFKLYPEDQVKEDARREEARKRIAEMRERGEL
jgi:hypothetical protein